MEELNNIIRKEKRNIATAMTLLASLISEYNKYAKRAGKLHDKCLELLNKFFTTSIFARGNFKFKPKKKVRIRTSNGREGVVESIEIRGARLLFDDVLINVRMLDDGSLVSFTLLYNPDGMPYVVGESKVPLIYCLEHVLRALASAANKIARRIRSYVFRGA